MRRDKSLGCHHSIAFPAMPQIAVAAMTSKVHCLFQLWPARFAAWRRNMTASTWASVTICTSSTSNRTVISTAGERDIQQSWRHHTAVMSSYRLDVTTLWSWGIMTVTFQQRRCVIALPRQYDANLTLSHRFGLICSRDVNITCYIVLLSDVIKASRRHRRCVSSSAKLYACLSVTK